MCSNVPQRSRSYRTGDCSSAKIGLAAGAGGGRGGGGGDGGGRRTRGVRGRTRWVEVYIGPILRANVWGRVGQKWKPRVRVISKRGRGTAMPVAASALPDSREGLPTASAA